VSESKKDKARLACAGGEKRRRERRLKGRKSKDKVSYSAQPTQHDNTRNTLLLTAPHSQSLDAIYWSGRGAPIVSWCVVD
jgi:hypothetical protein